MMYKENKKVVSVTNDFVEQSNDTVTDDSDVLPQTIHGHDIREILSSILTNDKVMSVIIEEYNKAINDLTFDKEKMTDKDRTDENLFFLYL